MFMRRDAAWFKDSIIYQIVLDRFAGVKNTSNPMTDEFCGGNIRGLIDKLSYFKNLGVNTLLLSPINEGVSYHGYHITDYFSVDSRWGSVDDLKELVDKAHSLEIKIILDFVPNHCSNRHPFFVKAKTNTKSRYRNWFYFKKDNSYLSFLDYDELPKLNLDYEPCRDYILSAARFWLDKGIDGLRLDHATGPSINFWKYFSKELNTSHPNAVLIGEVWTNINDLKQWKTLRGVKNKLSRYVFRNTKPDVFIKDYVGILDGCLDFMFNQIIRDYTLKKITQKEAYTKLQKHYSHFPKDFFLPTFLDNHDMERILLLANQDQEVLKELATWQFKIKQPQIIYYGTEVAMTQKDYFGSLKSHGDLLARQPMAWDKVGNEMFNFYKLLIAQKNRRLRKDGDILNKEISISGQITSL